MAGPSVSSLCTMLLQAPCLMYNTGPWPNASTSGPPTVNQCMQIFAGIPNGTLADVSGNTIGCRQNYATKAMTAGSEYYCPFASLSGGGVCGSEISNVCDRIVNVLCSGNTNIPVGWAGNASQCTADLTNANLAFIFGGNQGQAAFFENSLECRLYHAEAAYIFGSNSVHCAHANTTSPVCTQAVQPMVNQYCGLIETTCTGSAYQQYFGNTPFDAPTHWRSCVNSINTYPVGTGGVQITNNNDLVSRIYHVSANAGSGGNTVHCAHAGPSGGGLLGGAAAGSRVAWLNISNNVICSAVGNKFVYAEIAEAMGAFPMQLVQIVPQSTNLATYSVGMPDATSTNTTVTNTDACRIYHLSTAASNASSHCPHGSISGGGLCGDPTWTTCKMVMLGCPSAYSTIAACQAAFLPYFAAMKIGNPCGPLMSPPQVPADDSITCRVYYATTALATVAAGGTPTAAVCMNAAILGATGCNVSAMSPVMAPTSGAASTTLFGGLAFLAMLW